jgi:hypothetical protein
MKKTYLKFKVGDEVTLLQGVFDYKIEIPAGTSFVIKDFPPCTIPGKYMYFVVGKHQNNIIRCFPNEIKIKK